MERTISIRRGSCQLCLRTFILPCGSLLQVCLLLVHTINAESWHYLAWLKIAKVTTENPCLIFFSSIRNLRNKDKKSKRRHVIGVTFNYFNR